MHDSPGPQVRGGRGPVGGREAITGAGGHGRSRPDRALAAGAIPRPDQVSTTTPVHNLPRPAARVFEGREAALGQLGGRWGWQRGGDAGDLRAGRGRQVRTGAASRACAGDDYQLMWWITAADAARSRPGWPRWGRGCALRSRWRAPQQDAGGWAVGWLQAHDRWLLMLDNVDDPG